MVSHPHNFTFIHIPKTGGCSVEKALRLELSADKTPLHRLKPKKFAINYQHATLEEVHLLKPKTQHYFSFCFVRNPWARVVSYYCRVCKRKKLPPKFSFRRCVRGLQLEDFSFTLRHSPYVFLRPCSKWVKNISFVGKLENYDDDFNKVCDRIGIHRRQLPHKNKSKHRHGYKHYTEYYDDELREIVAEIYAEDIKAFGYSFG